MFWLLQNVNLLLVNFSNEVIMDFLKNPYLLKEKLPLFPNSLFWQLIFQGLVFIYYCSKKEKKII